MKKVVFSVSRYVKGELNKITGVGMIDDNDLIIALVSKKGNPYIRVFADAVKLCHKIPDRENEFTGWINEIREVTLTDEEGKNSVRELEFEYKIWFKYATEDYRKQVI